MNRNSPHEHILITFVGNLCNCSCTICEKVQIINLDKKSEKESTQQIQEFENQHIDCQ